MVAQIATAAGRAGVVTLFLLLATLPVRAAEDPAAAAMKRCLDGDVDGGVGLLAKIHAQSGDPVALYNQARCLQWNGRYREAIDRFHEYLRKAPAVTAAERAQIDGYIASMQNEPVAPVAALTVPAPAPEPAPVPARSLLPPVLGGVATLGLLGAGSVVLVQAQDRLDQVAARPVYDPTLDDSAHGSRKLGAALTVAGGVALIATVVLIYRYLAEAP